MKQLLLVMLIVVAGARGAAAQAPWAVGVPEDKQDRAIKLFDEGNQLFAQQAHTPALEKYKAALALWDHPKIRFNLAVTLIRLERVLEAADELEQAMRYGDKAFDSALYQQALDYQALLKRQVGYVEASCDQAGAHILLDGKPWFACPGKKKMRVMAGEHAITGDLVGHFASPKRVVVAGGATSTEKMHLMPLDSAVVLKYRFRTWVPWVVVGAGVVVGGAGLGFYLSGKSDIATYQRQFDTLCADGCPADLSGDQYSLLRSTRDSGEFNQRIGVATIGAGGAIVITGAVMFILNRPRRILPKVEVAPKSGGVAANVGWQF